MWSGTCSVQQRFTGSIKDGRTKIRSDGMTILTKEINCR